MQPYFFPHFAYFQLISAVDFYVNLDHVSFMKRSYMVRNRIKNNTSINISVKNASQNKKCTEVFIESSCHYIDKFKKTIKFLYGKHKNFELIFNTIIEPNFNSSEKTISQFNIEIIKSICDFLDIKTNIINSSEGITTEKREDGLIDIVKKYNGLTYINAIGGIDLYDKQYFKNKGIDLFFLKTNVNSFVDKNISILDLLFEYDKEFIVNEIDNYELI